MTIYYDATAMVYELFDIEGKWVGAYDTHDQADEARRIAGGPGDGW